MPITVLTPQTADTLARTATHIYKAAEKLRAVAALLADESIAELQVTNYDQLRRGLEFIDNYCGAVESALTSALEEKGSFRAGKSVRAVREKIVKLPRLPKRNK